MVDIENTNWELVPPQDNEAFGIGIGTLVTDVVEELDMEAGTNLIDLQPSPRRSHPCFEPPKAPCTGFYMDNRF